jgi:hypothetical protein
MLSGHCHLDAYVFQGLEQHQYETGSVMPTAHMSKCMSLTVQTPATE